jgi:hypothetical protein
MDDTIKKLVITGQAAEDVLKPSRRGASRKKRGGAKGDDVTAEVSGTPIEAEEQDDELIKNLKKIATASPAPVARSAPVVVSKPHATSVAPPVAALPPPPQHTPQPTLAAKVILKPPKQVKVRLQPKMAGGGGAQAKPAALAASVAHTRKARRIKLTVANLNHRFTRAKKVRETTDKETTDTIREFLVKRGVIQAKSKAPEKMLRSMYADFMLLKDHAL